MRSLDEPSDLPPIADWTRSKRGNLRYDNAERTAFITVVSVQTQAGETIHCTLFTRDEPYGGNVFRETSTMVTDVSEMAEQLQEELIDERFD